MANENRPLNKSSPVRRRNEHEPITEAARLSLINPFDTIPPRNPSFETDPLITVNGSLASPACDSNPLGLRQRPAQHAFLEMEEATGTALHSNSENSSASRTQLLVEEEGLFGFDQNFGRTSSGLLLLTHRQTPTVPKSRPNALPHDNDDKKRHASMRINGTLETDWGFASSRDPYAHMDPTAAMVLKARRLLSFAKVYIVLFAVILVVGTLSIIHSSTHERTTPIINAKNAVSKEKQLEDIHLLSETTAAVEDEPLKIILVPIQDISQLQKTQLNQSKATMIHHESNPPDGPVDGIKRALKTLREEFEEWIIEHEKAYESHDEKETRFHVWSQNHHATIKKNQRHGPCKLTNKPVFGSNMFKDLSTEEFKAKYLTGYNGPKTDELDAPMQLLKVLGKNGEGSKVHKTTPGSGMVLDAENRGDFRTAVERHPEVQKRLLEYLHMSEMGKKYIEHWDHPNRNQSNVSWYNQMGKKYIEHWDHSYRNQTNTSWYTDAVTEATLALREKEYFRKFKAFYDNGICNWYDVSCWLRWVVDKYGYYVGFTGTMEPAYDSDSYPTAVDWRTIGAVTSVHSQGSCGACWAITAVETVESAYFIAKGTLYELAETEVIACDESCEMCNGGWPQNAYEYILKYKGLPLENSLQYNSDFLYALTLVKTGQSYSLGEGYLESYMAATCPSGSSNNGKARYGNIKGYGYATDRCICYSDGSGCKCDKQDEGLAIANVATYGPATVCLEASLWQDYSGGIITSELGCSSAFLDMNHCVQAVGYAFDDVEDGDNGNKQKGSTRREGYWIIRNQWSSSWGMKGYAYVAMGENTCGVLNDMTLVYM